MRYPPRLAHLATRSVVVAKLAPTYAAAHHIEDEEAVSRLSASLGGPLLDDLLAAAWAELTGGKRRLDDEGLLEKVAGALKDRPQRPGRTVGATPGWSAFLVLADVRAGTASDAAQRIFESPEGKARVEQGLAEVGRFLATELTRK